MWPNGVKRSQTGPNRAKRGKIGLSGATRVQVKPRGAMQGQAGPIGAKRGQERQSGKSPPPLLKGEWVTLLSYDQTNPIPNTNTTQAKQCRG